MGTALLCLTGYKDSCPCISGKSGVPGKEDMVLGRLTALISRKGLAWERVIRKSTSFVCCLYAFIIIAFLWKLSFRGVKQTQCFTREANFKFHVLLPYPVVWMWLSIFLAFQTVARHWADALMVLSESVLEFSGNHSEPAQNLFVFSWFARH